MLATVVLAMFCRASAVRKAECGADEDVGVRLQQLELLVPGLVALAQAEGRPVLEEQGACEEVAHLHRTRMP